MLLVFLCKFDLELFSALHLYANNILKLHKFQVDGSDFHLQVLQKSSQWEKEKDNKSFSSRISSHFFLPHVLVCIFKFLASCNDLTARERMLKDLFELLDSNPSNIECLMVLTVSHFFDPTQWNFCSLVLFLFCQEYGWNSWLETSVKLYRTYGLASQTHFQSSAVTELALMRNLFCVVLSHYILSVKGGWHQLEETVYFLLLNFEEVSISYLVYMQPFCLFMFEPVPSCHLCNYFAARANFSCPICSWISLKILLELWLKYLLKKIYLLHNHLGTMHYTF